MPYRESELIEYIRKNFKGKLFIDVGAQFGHYSVNLSDQFDEVWAVEPIKANIEVLTSNLKNFSISNVKIIQKALSYEKKKTILYAEESVREGKVGLASLKQTYRSDIEGVQDFSYFPFIELETITLSELIGNSKVDLIKVDTEGNELDVLKGAEDKMNNIDTWLIEVHDSSEIKKVNKYLWQFNYKTEIVSNNYVFAKKLFNIPTWIEKERRIAKVAVLLCSYNRPKMVVRAIKSVLKQKFQDFTLYIIDNNSRPSVKQVLLRYKNEPRVQMYFLDTLDDNRLKKYFLGVMLNIGLNRGKEEYVQALTDDCIMLPNSLRDKVNYLESNQAIMACFGGQKITETLDHIIRTSFTSNQSLFRQFVLFAKKIAKKIILKYGRIMIRNHLPKNAKIVNGSSVVDLCQTMFRRSIIEKVGGKFNEDLNIPNYYVDAELFERIAETGHPLYSVGTITDIFVRHGKSFMDYLQKGRQKEILSGELWE